MNPYVRAAAANPAVQAQALERLASRLERAGEATERVAALRRRADQLRQQRGAQPEAR